MRRGRPDSFDPEPRATAWVIHAVAVHRVEREYAILNRLQ